MNVTKDQMTRDIADATGYYIQDVKAVLAAMDDVVRGYFSQVTDDEEVKVQIIEGCKLSVKVVPERTRRNPQTQEEIVCKAQTKPQAKFSEVFRELIQTTYEKNKEA